MVAFAYYTSNTTRISLRCTHTLFLYTALYLIKWRIPYRSVGLRVCSSIGNKLFTHTHGWFCCLPLCLCLCLPHTHTLPFGLFYIWWSDAFPTPAHTLSPLSLSSLCRLLPPLLPSSLLVSLFAPHLHMLSLPALQILVENRSRPHSSPSLSLSIL